MENYLHLRESFHSSLGLIGFAHSGNLVTNGDFFFLKFDERFILFMRGDHIIANFCRAGKFGLVRCAFTMVGGWRGEGGDHFLLNLFKKLASTPLGK